MSRREAFRERVPRPDPEDRTYRDRRNELYPGVGGGFPPPHLVPGGYSAEAGHMRYKDAQDVHNESRNAYFYKEKQSRNYVDNMVPERSDYYIISSGGYTPVDHRILQPLARTWADNSLIHAGAREEVLTAAPMLYSTAEGQERHWQYTHDKYDETDDAEERYQTHSRYARSVSKSTKGRKLDEPGLMGTLLHMILPAQPAISTIARPPSRGAIPFNDPYPAYYPPKGHYSTRQGHAEAFVITPKTSQGSRKKGRVKH
ncbi:MAG: hypothetical protein Q9212_003186 [Teloschistes hypoglaucus]